MDIFDAIRNKCDTDAVQRVLDADPQQISARTPDQDQPLHLAVWNRCTDIVRLLIDRGADVNGRGDSGSTPMHYAARYGGVPMVSLLAQAGASLEAEDDNGFTPLQVSRDAKVMQRLMKLGAAVDIITALDAGWTEQVKSLLQREPSILSKPSAQNALLIAVRQQNAELVKLLLEHGADPNVGAGTTPLFLAVSGTKNSGEIVRLLIDAGADVNATTGVPGAGPRTPLAVAEFVRFDEAVKLLRDAGAQS